MPLPSDYYERVYAGVLGKIIGVYLGRPIEGWSHDKILATLGEINYYVHEQRNVALIVTDDDITGTFTFLRALPDHGNSPALTAEQIGQTWLNYIIENRTILWWGGLGNSTEHTAYLRLKRGIPAPRSGSMELNGKVVAEQIGAQIFIDGWAMVNPGDPERAADFARRAASVSHDGEAIHGAQVVAAIEALAFVESDLSKLLDRAVRLIPADSVIFRMIADLRGFHAQEPRDWKRAFKQVLVANYGYDKFGGNCHMVPNHGVIILALLYGENSFQKSLMIANTCGWDTDCNSANVGCIMGIKLGLNGIDAGPDFRGPVADRLFLPTADGGRSISDAATEALHIVNYGRALQGQAALTPKSGARFHFELPGSLQGFALEDTPESRGSATLTNVAGHSALGRRSLQIAYTHVAPGRSARIAAATFIAPADLAMPGYALYACPILYPGQTVRAAVESCPKASGPVNCRLYYHAYGPTDELVRTDGPGVLLEPGQKGQFEWKLPGTTGGPIQNIGLEISAATHADGRLFLDYLAWEGVPELRIIAPPASNKTWLRAWVDATDVVWIGYSGANFHVLQNSGRGHLIQGTREWRDYRVETSLTPHLAEAVGLAVRVQGLNRYYAVLLGHDGQARLVSRLGTTTRELAAKPFVWELGRTYRVAVSVAGAKLKVELDGQPLLEATANEPALDGGAVALLVEEGRATFGAVTIGPVA